MKERIAIAVADGVLAITAAVAAKKLIDRRKVARRKRDLKIIFAGFTRADLTALANSDTPSRYAAAAMLRVLDEEQAQEAKQWKKRKPKS